MIKRIYGVLIRHLFDMRRNWESLSEVFWWPTFDLLIWGLTTLYLQQTQGLAGHFIGFFIGGMVFWMFVYRSQQDMGLTFLREFWDRNLLNMLTTPLSMGEFFIATLLLGVFRLALSALWIGLGAYILFAFNLLQPGWWLIPIILNLFLVGWSAGFFINGLILQYGYRIQAIAWTLIVALQPFSAVFYPVASLPEWAQFIAKLLPSSYIFEALRQVLGGQPIDSSLVLMASILNALYFMLSLYFFNHSYRRAQVSGIIVKFT